MSTLLRQQNGTYKYQTIRKEAEVSSSDLVIAETGYQYSIDTRQPGDFVLEVIDEQKHRIAMVHFSVIGFANLSCKIEKNAELQLKRDKSDYFLGDTIQMSIKAPYSGSGLITLVGAILVYSGGVADQAIQCLSSYSREYQDRPACILA